MVKKTITQNTTTNSIIPMERIENRIIYIRGHKVLLDRDLAELYGVTTGNLNKAVSRNIERFPDDFMFLLDKAELDDLIFQSGTSSWGGTRKPPRAFTEQGIAMLSGVLRSHRAVQVNIEIMRAFVRMRKMLASHVELARKIEQMEKKYDKQFQVVFQAIRQLMEPPPPTKSKEKFGFHSRKKTKSKK